MEKIHHADALVVVQLTPQDRPACRANLLSGRRGIEKVVNRLEPPGAQIGKDLLHAAFGFAEKNRIGVGLGFFGVQHGGDATKDDRYAPAPVFIGDRPAALDLTGEHHGNADKITRIVECEWFDVFVNELHIHVCGQSGGEYHRTMRGQVKLGLPGQLGPLGIDKAKPHAQLLRAIADATAGLG